VLETVIQFIKDAVEDGLAACSQIQNENQFNQNTHLHKAATPHNQSSIWLSSITISEKYRKPLQSSNIMARALTHHIRKIPQTFRNQQYHG
jgi:hypothetical protein